MVCINYYLIINYIILYRIILINYPEFLQLLILTLKYYNGL